MLIPSIKTLIKNFIGSRRSVFYSIYLYKFSGKNKLVFKRAPKNFKLNIIGAENSITVCSLTKDCSMLVTGNHNTIFFGKNANLKNIDIRCQGDHNSIFIADNSTINKGFINIVGDNNKLSISEFCIVGDGDFWLYGNACKIAFGEKCSLEKGHLAATENNTRIAIGKDCMFSTDIEIRTGDSHPITDIHTMQRINLAKDVIIEDHVWIGSRASILKGVTIGRNSIIGTGAVVTSDVPQNSIFAGVPARKIKDNVTWQR